MHSLKKHLLPRYHWLTSDHQNFTASALLDANQESEDPFDTVKKGELI